MLQYVEPVWSGTMVYRSLVPAERLREVCGGREHRVLQHTTIYCGKDKHLISYSIGKGASTVNIALTSCNPNNEGKPFVGPWVTDCTSDDVRQVFRNFEPEVQELLQCVDKVTLWAIHALRPLPFYVTTRVALLGDAAHAMLPYQGAGAGQAIEDAFILASLLGHPATTAATVSHALHAYEAVRLPFANARIEGSRMNGLMYSFNSIHGDHLESLVPAFEAQWNWLWDVSVDEEVQTSLELMTHRVSTISQQISKL